MDPLIACPKLREIFANQILSASFQTFLNSRLCAENLAFHKAIVSYKKLDNANERKERGVEIYGCLNSNFWIAHYSEMFITDDAFLQINIPSHTKSPLVVSHNSGEPDVFDLAQHDVLRLLEHDSASSFFCTDAYKSALAGTGPTI